MCKKNYNWNNKHLKCSVDDSVILCDKIINVTNNVSTNVTNTIPTSVTSIVPKNSDDVTVRYKMDCYIHTMSLITVSLLLLLVVNSIGCYCYFIDQKQKTYCLINMK